ncbi:MAG: nickel pincer cofactor biosynthesis protein LarB [Desulfovibrionales bacterium]|nr:nickel pincer cofactor biosynthesis protein LarB [Desulfovibrionales bacterium]
MTKICFDSERADRIGLPEAVFCEGKPKESIEALLQRFNRTSGHPVLFTRLQPEVFASFPLNVQQGVDYHPLSRTAFGSTLEPVSHGRVAVVSAGTSDAPVAWEVVRTLEYLGIAYEMFEDCGVAGLWRLTQSVEKINACDVGIVIAGLDAAMATVLGGLCPKPLFAVPTSVGYGVATGGTSALSSMLSSCAPGIGVMNIDNGYGAACAASRIIKTMCHRGK